MKSSKSSRSFQSCYGIRQLALAFILVTVIIVPAFMVINAFIEKTIVAMGLTILWLVIAFVVILQLALKQEVSMVWQYSVSQLAVAGAVFGLFSAVWVDIGFLIATVGFGLAAAVMFYFNLGDKDLRGLHKSYVPIHLLVAILAFGIMYFKCN